MIKKLLIAFLVLIVALPVVVWFGAPAFADSQLRNLLTKADTASYSYLELDLWEGNIVVHDLFLIDSSGAISEKPVYAALDRLAVKGFDWWRLYRKKELSIDSLTIGKGYVQLPLYKEASAYTKPDTTTVDTTKAAPPKLPITLISLHHVTIDSMGFSLALNPKNDQEKYEATLRIKADGIEAPLTDSDSIYYKNASLKLSHIYVQAHKKVAYYTLDSLAYAAESGVVDLYGFKLNQRISQYRYGAYFKSDKAFGKVEVPRVTLKGFPRKIRKMRDGIHLKRITAYDPQGYLYKDHRYPHTTNPKPFIVELLFNVKLPITVDTVDLVDGQLYFNENWREDYVPGNINLTQMNVRMLNYTNRPTEKNYWTKILGSFTLFDKLKIDVDWRFDLRKQGKAFTLDLRIGESPFSLLNPYTENTFGARFTKGKLLGGHMRVEGNEKSGGGSLELYYKKLKIELLDRHKHEQNFWRWAGGGLANAALRSSNMQNDNPKLGICYNQPHADRAIFAYAINLFFSGFQDIAVGSGNEKQLAKRGMMYLPMPKQAKEELQKKRAKEQKKEEKEARKAERRAKREAKKSS